MSFDLPGVKPGSDIETLFKAVGFVVVQWGMDEQHLDLIVAVIFHRFGGHPLLNRRPTNLSQKIPPLPVSAEQVYEGFAQFFGPYSELPPKVRAKYEHTAWFINQRGA